MSILIEANKNQWHGKISFKKKSQRKSCSEAALMPAPVSSFGGFISFVLLQLEAILFENSTGSSTTSKNASMLQAQEPKHLVRDFPTCTSKNLYKINKMKSSNSHDETTTC